MSKLTSLICTAALLGATSMAYADNHAKDGNHPNPPAAEGSDKAQRPDGNTAGDADTGAKKSDVQKLRKKSDTESKPNQSGGSNSSDGKY